MRSGWISGRTSSSLLNLFWVQGTLKRVTVSRSSETGRSLCADWPALPGTTSGFGLPCAECVECVECAEYAGELATSAITRASTFMWRSPVTYSLTPSIKPPPTTANRKTCGQTDILAERGRERVRESVCVYTCVCLHQLVWLLGVSVWWT